MEQEEYTAPRKVGKQHNTLPLWGNEASMNLNPLILANIQGSSYFKVHLFKLKTYHEVVDEIYYQVKHLEPWERGSRKTSGQTGMCGGVRGVGAGGIVSTAFCLLYKLYTMRLTRKQVNGLLNHSDSPYIRALGFMYIRYTQPPGDLYDWYEDYLLDDEEIDVKAGGGQTMTIGQMAHQFLVKLDWFSTLFPRIPVPIQKQIEKRLENFCLVNKVNFNQFNVRTGAAASSRGGPVSGLNASQYDGDRDYVDRGRRDERDRDYSSRGSGGSYRPEHDERVGGNHDYHRRERDDRYDRSPSNRERREKHKKKHKHRSRSRSRSRSRDRYKETAKSSHRTSDRDYDSYDRRYR